MGQEESSLLKALQGIVYANHRQETALRVLQTERSIRPTFLSLNRVMLLKNSVENES